MNDITLEPLNEPAYCFIRKPTIHEFTFYNDDQWCIKINEKGIFFNRERYPESTPEDFADAFIEILEKNYTVSFTKKD